MISDFGACVSFSSSEVERRTRSANSRTDCGEVMREDQRSSPRCKGNLLRMHLQAGVIGRHGSSDFIDGMSEEVFPNSGVGE